MTNEEIEAIVEEIEGQVALILDEELPMEVRHNLTPEDEYLIMLEVAERFRPVD